MLGCRVRPGQSCKQDAADPLLSIFGHALAACLGLMQKRSALGIDAPLTPVYGEQGRKAGVQTPRLVCSLTGEEVGMVG